MAASTQRWVIISDARPVDGAWLASLVPALVGSVLERGRLVLLRDRTTFVLDLDLTTSALEPAHRQRLQFWCAQAGARMLDLGGPDAQRRGEVDALLARKLTEWTGPPSSLEAHATSALAAADVAETARAPALRGLLVDVGTGHPGAPAVASASPTGILLETSYVLPVGDEIFLQFGPSSPPALQRVAVRVVFTRRAAADGSRAAGFGVAPVGHDAGVAQALACFGVTTVEPSKRAHPRYDTVARIRYATEDDFSDDYITNLSFGGALVLTQKPAEVDTEMPLVLELPSGATVQVDARVVARRPNGMGVQFKLGPQTERILAAELSRISCRPRRVLVVDDEPGWRDLLTRAFQKEHLEVLLAEDGQRALEVLATDLMSVDLVMTDANMPVMDGKTLLTRIRLAGGETELPIVAMSSDETPGLSADLRTAGADLFLPKTTPLDEMVRRSLALATEKRMKAALGDTGSSAPAAW